MDRIVTGENNPRPGETLSADSFKTIPGGKGANQAIACAKLGANIKMVGRIGNDYFGQDLQNSLISNNVDNSFVLVDENVPTGVALISVNKHGENSISGVYGANMSLPEKQLIAAKESIHDADFLLLQNEIPVELNMSIAKYAKSKNIPVFWDPAPANKDYIGIMEFCSYITPNIIEAEEITGLNIKTPEQAIKACEWISDSYPEITPLITLDKEGVAVSFDNNTKIIKSFEVDVVDTIGAGDAFFVISSLFAFLRSSLIDIGFVGNVSGALKVNILGHSSNIKKSQFLKFIEAVIK